MKPSIISRIAVSTSLATAFLALFTACGSAADSDGSTPAMAGSPTLHAESLSCVHTRRADSTALSDALASCGCSADPVHVDGCSERWSVSDCSNAEPTCVNAVLDTNGYRSAPWDAFTTSVGSCIHYAVVYDPCGGVCRTFGPGGGGGDDAGTTTDWCPSLQHRAP